MREGISTGGCRFEGLAFWVSGVVALLVYVVTLGNGVGFGFSNHSVVAASTWGISAPPGYPVWTIIGNLFTMLFGWVSWGGEVNPAWSLGVFSAFCGAWAVGLFARLAWLVLMDCLFVRQREGDEGWLPSYVCFVSCCVALLFAFSPLMWSCAVRASVDTWEMLLFVGILFWSYRFLRCPTASVLGVLLFLFGIGLTNGMSFLWFGVPLWGMVFVAHRPLAKALLSFLIPLGLTAHLLLIGALPSAYEGHLVEGVALARPMACAMHGVLPLAFLPWGYYFAFGGLFVVGVGSLFLWPRLHRSAVISRRVTGHWWLGVLLSGVVFFGVLLHAITTVSYVLSPSFKGTLYSFVSTWGIHLFALVVLWGMCLRFHRSRRYALAVTFVQVGLLFLYQHGFMVGLTHPRLWWFWWPLVWVGCLLVMGRRWLLCGRGAMMCILLLLAGCLFYLYVPLVSCLGVSPEQWGAPFSWVGFHRLFADGIGLGLPTRSTFVAIFEMFGQLCFGDGLGVLFWGSVGFVMLGLYGVGRYRVRWLVFLMVWVLCCCLVFLLLPEEPLLQPNLLQHRLEVLFIFGIGGLVAIPSVQLLRRLDGPSWGWGCLCLVSGLVLFLGWGVFRTCVGAGQGSMEVAPEARGHFFAWQWGAVALEGASRLERFLTEDDEPLPDPFWPPPIERDAVMLTSSFVPYYMTQVVDVRPDVRVLTHAHWADELAQAARERWPAYAGIQLPSEETVEDLQHRLHFKEYAWLTAEATTDQEKLEALLLHWVLEKNVSVSFYLESPAPYSALYRQLEPAGLSLKVATQTPQTRAVGMRDVDFWDWYSRYLSQHFAYHRDAPARKQFTALQRALASLYRQQGEIHWSYCSLITAMSAYPIDSTIDYVEVFLLRALALEGTKMPLSNYENALRMLHAAEENDPENKALVQLLATIQEEKKALECCKCLQLSLNRGTISINERCLYIEACLQLHALDEAREVAWVFAERFIPPTHLMEVIRLVMRLETPELLYEIAAKMPAEMYKHFTERELLEIVKVALDYQHRSLAKSLLAEGEERFGTSAALHWMKACYYHVYEDPSLAYHHLCLAREISPLLMDACSEDEKTLCQEIEDRYQRLQEKGTRL